MTWLQIQHIENGESTQFRVSRLSDGKSAGPFPVPPPLGFPVEGLPNRDLVWGLNWYLETFLEYPFSPETERADQVQAALEQWGRSAFQSLFGGRDSALIFEKAAQSGYQELHLSVSSDDPLILSWPWEALYDPRAGFLANTCQIERRLNCVCDPIPVSKKLPKDRVNILLITARPYERDVRYRSISRPLLELIEKQKLPACVHALRPPTFDRLREHLRERPHFYHILHFDGHGAYGVEADSGEYSGYTLRGPEGKLAFEGEKGNIHLVSAAQLSELLREHEIPAVVLNACQSAKLDARAGDPFASVAASLLKAGVRSVVAMAYSLYVSGAQKFFPAFYRRLFESGNVAQGTRAGRQEMRAHPERVCARGMFPLNDWLVPVLYQQDPLDFSFFRETGKSKAQDSPIFPAEALGEDDPYGFIGRDDAILELERALHRHPPAILLQGLGGVGKTTLAKGFLRWLRDTEGLGNGAFWFAFYEIRSAEHVFNRMGESLFRQDFGALGMEEKIERLTQAFRNRRFLIVWDDFEPVCGIPGSSTQPTLSAEDRGYLLRFLRKLAGGQSKVLITSRSDEEWLGTEVRGKIGIRGLQGEERWEYCEQILAGLGIRTNRSGKDLIDLVDFLEGHPLAMRVLLPMLEKRSADDILQALRTNLAGLGLKPEDEAHAKLYATLRFAEQSLPNDLHPLLVPLSLYERYLVADHLAAMAKEVDPEWTREQIDRFTGILCGAGLLRDCGQAIYELHPALTGFLRTVCTSSFSPQARAMWAKAFVHLLATVADCLAHRPLHEQRIPFHVHRANFYYALAEAKREGDLTNIAALAEGLASFAQNSRIFHEAEILYANLADSCRAAGAHEIEARAYHHLGIVASQQRYFDAAGRWYRKALEIKEKQGDKQEAAITYHQLGNVAQEQRDFDAAEKWYQKVLTILKKQGEEHGAAGTYHQLGRVAEERHNFDVAERWYKKSLTISEKLGDEYGAAGTYHQLGIVAQGRRDFNAAERWHKKSLEIKEKQRNEHGAAATYYNLGIVAEGRRDFDAAERWYKKSLTISEKLGDEYVAAATYNGLGTVAQERRDLDAAERWYKKSLAIFKKLDDEHGAAINYYHLGRLDGLRKRYEESGTWLIRCIRSFHSTNDPEIAKQCIGNFIVLYKAAPSSEQKLLRTIWQNAGFHEHLDLEVPTEEETVP